MIALSLAEFLNTGALGPLRPGTTLHDVADALGAPAWWNVDDDHSVPHYWGYGKHLEIAFRFDGTPCCDWFQLEYVGGLDGNATPISDDFVLVHDGLIGAPEISRFIEAAREIDRVRICLFGLGGKNFPSVWIGTVEIVLNCEKSSFDTSTPLDQVVSILEADARVDSIYSHDRAEAERRFELFRKAKDAVVLSGRDYLEILSASSSPDALSDE